MAAHRSSASLRAEISARNLLRTETASRALVHETTFGRTQHVIYAVDEEGSHGNFLPAVYRRIRATPQWARRLEKSYTGSARVPRAPDRRRGELECANSSDALLMNVFCFPGALRRAGLCALLGVGTGLRPDFGVRALLPMRRGEIDRTEIDLRLGDLLVEAKLTENDFGNASRERLMRYEGVAEVFEIEDLPWSRRGVLGYQLIRGLLAARAADARFAVICDARRSDLREAWFRVARAVRRAEDRSRFLLLTWQEIAATMPSTVQVFLEEKYGITADDILYRR